MANKNRDVTIITGIPPSLQRQMRENVLGSKIGPVFTTFAMAADGDLCLSGTNADGRSEVRIYRTDTNVAMLWIGGSNPAVANQAIPLSGNPFNDPLTLPLLQEQNVFGHAVGGPVSGIILEL